jgi:hypothetical protein
MLLDKRQLTVLTAAHLAQEDHQQVPLTMLTQVVVVLVEAAAGVVGLSQ